MTIVSGQPIQKRRRLKMAHINNPADKVKKIPAIRIAGKYLADLGFKIGGYVMMEINPDLSITLRPDKSLPEDVIFVPTSDEAADEPDEEQG